MYFLHLLNFYENPARRSVYADACERPDDGQPPVEEIRAVNYTIGERKGRSGSSRSLPCSPWLLSPPRFVSLVQPSALYSTAASPLPATKSSCFTTRELRPLSFRRCHRTENPDKGDVNSVTEARVKIPEK